jgi:uncharacterized protein YjaG (DUF416 family)
MLRRGGRSREDERRVSELHERRQELVQRLIVKERYAAQLDDLPDSHCIALAAAAAERLLPLYEKFQREEGWGDFDFLRRGLDAVWDLLAGQRAADSLRGQSAAGEDRAVPDLGGDERWQSDWVSEAQDAAISVLLTMEAAVEENRESALHAVRCEIDAVDNYIARNTAVPHTKPPAGADTLVHALEEQVEREEKTVAHPLMKETLEIIEHDLKTVRSTTKLTPDVVGALRALAAQKSTTGRVERS